MAPLRALFPAARPDALGASTAALMTDAMVAWELANAAGTPAAAGLEWADVERAPALFADASRAGAALRERAPPADAPCPEQWTREGARPMEARWEPRFRAASEELASVLAALHGTGRVAESVLGHLYAQMGHECGVLLRAMHRAGISWGTYVDAMCFDGQWHCNAHTNNLVVLSEAQAAQLAPGVAAATERPLLACLDTDMAFSAATFVDMPAKAIGVPAATFGKLLERERINFAEVLAGGDASSGVPAVAMAALDGHSDAVRVARHALHDTAVRSFLEAYDGGEGARSAPRMDALLHRGAYAALRMAIIVMADCLA